MGDSSVNWIACEEVDMSMSVCHWCCHDREGVMVGIPFRYDESRGVFLCIAKAFCSFPCAVAYLHKEVRGALQVKCQSLMPILYRRMGGDLRELPRAAPQRQSLKMFGGTLSIAEFRSLALRGVRVEVSHAPVEICKEFVNAYKHRTGYQPTNRAAVPIPCRSDMMPGSSDLDIMNFLKRV